MSTTKVNADVMDLTDAYAFTGAVSGAGKILQVVTASDIGYTSHASTSHNARVNVISASITPTSASSTILITGHLTASSTNSSFQYVGISLKRGATIIGEADNTAWHASVGEAHSAFKSGAGYSKPGTGPFSWEDSPSTTSATTYNVEAWANHWTSSLQVSTLIQNGGGYSYNNLEAVQGTTFISLMEISG